MAARENHAHLEVLKMLAQEFRDSEARVIRMVHVRPDTREGMLEANRRKRAALEAALAALCARPPGTVADTD